ncbi:MAG: hypothetical protein Salg2KO_19670 [Salibacteraceae bacterium]
MNWKYTSVIALFYLVSSCSSGDADNKEIEKIEEQRDTTIVEEVKSDLVEEHSLEPAPKRVKNPKVDSLRAMYEKDSWEYNVLDFIESEDVLIALELDKVPFEGDELPAEAAVQLQNLSDISIGFPYLSLEIQAHTTKAENKVARAAKKATSKARALWVATKLNMRGVPSERLSSKGMADEELIDSIDPDDKRQKRIVAVISKSEQS